MKEISHYRKLKKDKKKRKEKIFPYYMGYRVNISDLTSLCIYDYWSLHKIAHWQFGFQIYETSQQCIMNRAVLELTIRF